MIKLYTLPGCPMCTMLKQELDTRKIPYESITDQEVMRSMGISHVPVLELSSGQLMPAAVALSYVKGGCACVG